MTLLYGGSLALLKYAENGHLVDSSSAGSSGRVVGH